MRSQHIFFNRFILGAVDEVTAAMEDNIMTLQSMVASQFIGPFLQAVQKMERALSLGVEIIDEWMATQRKWCYLEGIFVGGDIRSQLPDEARKFDDIDKSFQRVNFVVIFVITKTKWLCVFRLCTHAKRIHWFCQFVYQSA